MADLATLLKDPSELQVIATDANTGKVLGAIRIAYGLVLSVEADFSINVSPVSEFVSDADGQLRRSGDPNKANVLTYVAPVWIAAQSVQASLDE